MFIVYEGSVAYFIGYQYVENFQLIVVIFT